ncbi:hypothetical protein OOZ15_06010 [Galbibacter sp. EGI 63066]|uniref:hypothetical protein n=1 Tax=Galbibacter sp. EGI 63066 TaxID=2993559 RepID=UPI0022494E64|nr:hypothetical protein [Galbibacter sp. EGI 63066]MCX2679492.1 hypothetical protein [Galbibacter sp. EGI 63066]
MNKIFLLGLFLLSIGMYAQSDDLNNYKYIIVPKKFDFLKQKNQYRVNTFTKFQFEKSGFTAVYDDAKPEELQTNPCLGLTADVVNNSSMFTTKLNITLEDCRGDIVYTSSEGKSKTKDYQGAYQEALENAFRSIKTLNYAYDPVEAPSQPKVGTVSAQPTVVSTPTPVAEKTETVVEETTTAVQEVKETPKTIVPAAAETVQTAKDALFAQPIANGFQLVDMTPKVVYKILKTTQPNYFILQGKSGVVFQKGGKWIAEYYEGATLKQEELNIKF